MKKLPSLLASSILVLAAVSPTPAFAGQNVNLVFDGIPSANVSTPPATQAFADWCSGSCFPTTQFPVYDATTGINRGTAYVWGKSFAFGTGGSLCFSEFIAFSLREGDLHVVSGPNGTCGAPIDPALKPPLHADLGALVVIAGGGDGVIAGGTGRFEGWTGSFTDRVFVGFGAPTSGVGGIIYYDQLLFRVTAE
ncbi:hypothetical protein [Piscinibacter sp.]|uniref:hypothetical protein n=1 Tax=Piscinibacter sp. TaxID=1903157 RepID=UPI002BACCFE8|nr:hypothetical protein [Albitalea sp.]HUG22366.1 hypothetical protein [Albitalea sp.]